MAGNNFKLFDENRQNMLSDQEYNDSQQRLSGVQAGIASSMLNNKFSYQMSLVAYAIAQMMNANGYDATDSLAVSAFVGNLSNSVLQKVIDKATSAEAIAGTNDAKWITPAKVKQFAESHIFTADKVTISQEVADALGLSGDPTVNDGLAIIANCDKTVKATYPVAAGQSITAGDVVDVVDGEVTARKVAISTLAVGTVIQLNENGSPVDYIVVHRGLPSAIYDSSCNGTWLLRKDIFESRQWHNSNTNDYANSDIKAYLDSTFLNRFDANIKAAIKQVKIPYRPGSGTSMTVNSGASGLSCKIFFLSGYEMGWTSADSQYFPADGAKLSYFDAGTGTAANNKRIGYLSSSAASWWLRSPNADVSTVAWLVNTGGAFGSSNCSSSYGVRPALILDNNFPIVKNSASQAIALTNATAGQDCEVIYSGVTTFPGITAGQKITSDGVYGVGVLAGVLQVWSKDRPEKIVTGSYVGTGLYGADSPNSITFLSAIKLIIITAPATETSSRYVNILIADNTVRLFGNYGGMGINTTTYTVLNGGNTLQWYANMAANQFNELGLSYEYIALV